MRRRDFIRAIACSATAWPLNARGRQTGALRRIGVVVTFAESDHLAQSLVKALSERLEELGWAAGRNIDIAVRWDVAGLDRGPARAEEIVEIRPDVILGVGGEATVAVSHATRSVPIIFVQVVDPIALGLVSNLAQPGGNISGFTNFEATIGGKWLQTLKEISPGITRVAAMFDPENTPWRVYFSAIEDVAASFKVQLSQAPVRNASEIERSMEQLVHDSVGGLIILPNPVTQLNRELTLALAIQHGVPTICPYRFYAESGGLVSYGVDLPDLYRRAASYVDRILRGEKPGDLPIQQPTKFELAINLKTAKSLGITIPSSLLASATR